ncbi:hypothetical protein [Halorubrum sp. Atlit-26R]|uniref:hypothetical protein n=1 Tax=Halorubrum sp. Atlit-26R TaxID=2282128 RepID=UPI0011C3F290|nr:hypothetical protein [Halorubrum sp. Atlit-26R]
MTKQSNNHSPSDSHWPPLDVIGVVVFLVLLGFVFLFYGFLSQLSGPVVDTGIPPQIVSGAIYGLSAIVMFALAFLIYRRHSSAWSSGIIVGIAVAILNLYSGVANNPIGWGIVILPLVFVVYLYLRRDIFHPEP